MPCFVLCDIQAKLIRGREKETFLQAKSRERERERKREKIQLPLVKSSEQLYVRSLSLSLYVCVCVCLSLYSFMKHKVHNSIAFQEWVCLKPLCKLLSIPFFPLHMDIEFTHFSPSSHEGAFT